MIRPLLAHVMVLVLVASAAVAADVSAGSRVTLTATAEGSLPMSFEWFKDGATVGTGPTYIIPTMSAAAAGSYTVKASNTAGNATSAPEVLRLATTTPPPSIAPTNPRITVEVITP